MRLLLGAHARQGIEIRRQPALILRQHAVNEITGRMWTCAHQLCPTLFGGLAAGNNYGSGANADPAAVKVKNGCVCEQAPQSHALQQLESRLRVKPRQSRIQPIHTFVVQEQIEQSCSTPLFGRQDRCPIPLREQNGNARRREGVAEGSSFLQRLFEPRQREAGINSEKRALRVGCDQRGIFGAAAVLKFVSKNLNQLARVIASGHMNHPVCADQRLQRPGLLDIAIRKHQVLRLPLFHVPVKENIARQQRQHLRRAGLLAHARHAQKRA